MLPTKLPNSRRGNPSAVRRSTFGTDAGLVALRYEKTVQAEPPIPVVSRNSVRSSRRPSTSSASSHHSHHHHPIVIAPPTGVAPPAEEHPAFRTSPSSSLRTSPIIVEEWKRDSGVARTNSTSNSTIHEEDDEDECLDEPSCDQPCKQASSATLVTSQLDDPYFAENSITAALTSVSSNSSIVSDARCTTQSPKSHSPAATTPCVIPSPAVKETDFKTPKVPGTSSQSTTATPASSSESTPRSSFSSPRRLMKGLSLRPGSTFRTPSLTQVLAPMQPLWRGSEPQSSADGADFTEASGARIATAVTTANAPGISPSASTQSATEASTTATATATTGPKLFRHKHKATLSSSSPKSVSRFWHRRDSSSTSTATRSSDLQPFVPLDVSIPCDNLLDHDYFLSSVSFSKRGSIMFSNDAPAVDANASVPESTSTTTPTPTNGHERAPATPPTPASRQSQARPSSDTVDTDDDLKKNYTMPKGFMSPPDIRVLAADVEKESQKVRSLYDVGDSPYGEPGSRRSYCERLEPTPEAPSEDNDNVPYGFLAVPSSHLRT